MYIEKINTQNFLMQNAEFNNYIASTCVIRMD